MPILGLRRVVQWAVVVVMIFAAYPVTAQDDELTMTFVSPDGSLSFRYPAGWTAEGLGSFVSVMPPDELLYGLIISVMTPNLFAEFELPASATADELFEAMRTSPADEGESVTITRDTTAVTFNNMAGLMFEAEVVRNERANHYTYIVLTAADGAVILVLLINTPETVTQHQATEFAILETLVYTPITLDLADLAPITPENVAQLTQIGAKTIYLAGAKLLYSPDGRYLLYDRFDFVGVELQNEVVVLDSLTFEEIRTLPIGENHRISDFALSSDGTQVAVITYPPADEIQRANTGQFIRMLDVEQGTTLWSVDTTENAINKVIFSPDDQHIAVGYATGKVEIRDAATGEEILEFEIELGTGIFWHNDQPKLGSAIYEISRLAYSPDGSFLAVCLWVGGSPVGIYNATSGELLHVPPTEVINCTDMDYHPAGTHVVAAAPFTETRITLWNTADWSVVWEIEQPELGGRVLFSPDGSLVATTGDNFLRMYDTATGALLTEIDVMQGQPFEVPPTYNGLTFSPSGDAIAVMGTLDGDTLRIFGVRP